MNTVEIPRQLAEQIRLALIDTSDLMAHLLGITWQAGYRQCQRDTAALGGEIGAIYAPPVPTPEEMTARRIAEYEAFAASSGRPAWTGTHHGAQVMRW